MRLLKQITLRRITIVWVVATMAFVPLTAICMFVYAKPPFWYLVGPLTGWLTLCTALVLSLIVDAMSL